MGMTAFFWLLTGTGLTTALGAGTGLARDGLTGAGLTVATDFVTAGFSTAGFEPKNENAAGVGAAAGLDAVTGLVGVLGAGVGLLTATGLAGVGDLAVSGFEAKNEKGLAGDDSLTGVDGVLTGAGVGCLTGSGFEAKNEKGLAGVGDDDVDDALIAGDTLTIASSFLIGAGAGEDGFIKA